MDGSSVPIQSHSARRGVVASFWAFVILGVPVWWHTTTTERRALPRAEVAAWKARGVRLHRFDVIWKADSQK